MGVVVLNTFMLVNRQMEVAVEECFASQQHEEDPDGDGDSYDSLDNIVGNLDKAVAFYTGLTQDVGNSGFLMYSVAELFCHLFKTCGEAESKVNEEVFVKFRAMQDSLLEGECDRARTLMDGVTEQMYVPLIQAVLYCAYEQGVLGRDDPKINAMGAMYTAAFLPMVHAHNEDDAEILYENMKVGSATVDFATVKEVIEGTYGLVGVTCKDVGGFWGRTKYYEGAEPCVDSSTLIDEDSYHGERLVGVNPVVSVMIGALSFLVTAFAYWLFYRFCLLRSCHNVTGTSKAADPKLELATKRTGQLSALGDDEEAANADLQVHTHTLD